MTKLSKEKKQQIGLILFGAAFVSGLLWYFVVQSQYTRLADVRKKTGDMADKVGKAEALLTKSENIETSLDDSARKLESIENQMASGDIYLWMINTINRFNASKTVTFLDFQRETVGEVGIFAKFPYKAAIFPVKGTAYYHDLGRFLADFENSFPHVRVQNLELSPSTKTAGEEGEVLNFKFEIVALIKPVRA